MPQTAGYRPAADHYGLSAGGFTSLIFAFRAENIHALALFVLSLIVIALLVALERTVR